MFNERKTSKYDQGISRFEKEPNKASRNKTINIKTINRKLNSQLNTVGERICELKDRYE